MLSRRVSLLLLRGADVKLFDVSSERVSSHECTLVQEPRPARREWEGGVDVGVMRGGWWGWGNFGVEPVELRDAQVVPVSQSVCADSDRRLQTAVFLLNKPR